MAISGNLADFSLPEIFQFLDRGSKTGLLKIRGLFENETFRYSYIWLDHGRVVAMSDRLDRKGLSNMIERRGWFKNLSSPQDFASSSLDMPLGLHLKSLGVLQTEQLKMLFSMQVIRQVCTIFHLDDGKFHFDHNVQMPKAEMTGLSLPASEATLMGLRGLRNWTMLNEKLPASDSTIFTVRQGHPQLKLEFQELQLLNFANGRVPLRFIAEQLKLPIEKVQQIAFRLIVVGIIEEDPGFPSITDVDCAPEKSSPEPEVNLDAPGRDGVSTSFLQSLLGFLQNKA